MHKPNLLFITSMRLVTGTMMWVDSSGMVVDWSYGVIDVMVGDGWGFGGVMEIGVRGVVQVDSSVVFDLFVFFKSFSLHRNKLTPHRLTPGWVIDAFSKLSCDIRVFIDIQMWSVLFRVCVSRYALII